MSTQPIDRNGEPISIGDTVSAKARGGKHAGEVKEIVTDRQEAEDKGLKNLPKVVLEDQVCFFLCPCAYLVEKLEVGGADLVCLARTYG